MTFIAGAFNVKYGGAVVGQIQDGVTIEHFVNKQLIRGDNFAQAPQDAVYQGEECFAEFTMMEYNNGAALDAFWPYSATYGTMGNIGTLDVGSSLVKILLLDHTSLGTGTTAATQPTTFKATQAILAEGYPVRLLFAPALRTIPVRMRLYPTAAGVFFTLT